MSIFAAGINEYIPQRGLRGGFGKKAEEKQGGQIWFAGSDRPDVLVPAGREKLGHGTINLVEQGDLYNGTIHSERPEFLGIKNHGFEASRPDEVFRCKNRIGKKKANKTAKAKAREARANKTREEQLAARLKGKGLE